MNIYTQVSKVKGMDLLNVYPMCNIPNDDFYIKDNIRKISHWFSIKIPTVPTDFSDSRTILRRKDLVTEINRHTAHFGKELTYLVDNKSRRIEILDQEFHDQRTRQTSSIGHSIDKYKKLGFKLC